jgi:uncharacterized protein
MKYLLLLCCLLPTVAGAASFDCTRAETPAEKLICANDGLSRMDELLQSLYQRALQQTAELETIKKQQLDWLRERDQTCNGGSLKYCELTYLDGYRMLSAYFHQSEKGPLLDGMRLPAESEPNSDAQPSMFNSEQVGLYDENSLFWQQKKLVEIKHGQVISLRSVVVAEIPYLLYVAKVAGIESYPVYEYNMLTRQSYLIENLANWQDLIIMQPTLFNVVGTRLYYPKGGNYQRLKLEEQQLMAYEVGSQSAPKEVSGVELLPAEDRLFFEFYTASQDGRWLATVSEYLSFPDMFRYTNSREMGEYFDQHQEKSDGSLIYIYDRLRRTGYGLNFEQWKPGEGWAIGGLAFHERLPVLFFDNHGPQACIWTYDLELKELIKIVPQHEAKLPRPFIYKDQNYLAFVMNDETENSSSWIYLAAGELVLP